MQYPLHAHPHHDIPTSSALLRVVQDFSKDERAALAVKARAHAPVFGSPDRQAVTDEVHAEMLQREPKVPPQPPALFEC